MYTICHDTSAAVACILRVPVVQKSVCPMSPVRKETKKNTHCNINYEYSANWIQSPSWKTHTKYNQNSIDLKLPLTTPIQNFKMHIACMYHYEELCNLYTSPNIIKEIK
jgi:hypothetical protein